MTDSIMRIIQDNPDRVYFPFMGNDNIFTRGFKINDIMFTIPGTDFEIHWYGFLIAMGLLLALMFAEKQYKKFGIDPDRAFTCVIGGGIAAVLGARFYYVIFSLSNYKVDGKIDWIDVFSIRDGGLAIYGGIIFGLLAAAIIAKIKKINLLALFDIASMGFLIGQAIGRWGNYFNMECYGSPTKLPWAMTSSSIMNELSDLYPNLAQNDLLAHPCFLYESLWCILGFVGLLIFKKHRKFDGEIFLMYIGWYGLGRGFIEGLRTDSLYIGNSSVRVSQLVAICCATVAIVIIAIARVKIKKSGTYKFFYETETSINQLKEYEETRAKINEKKINKKAQKNMTSAIENAFEDTIIPDEILNSGTELEDITDAEKETINQISEIPVIEEETKNDIPKEDDNEQTD